MSETIQPEGNYYNKYASKNPMVKWIMNGFFASLDSMLSDLEFSNVYEAGCGEGIISEYIYNLKNGQVDYHASDISARLVENAAKEFPYINFSEESIYEIESEDDAYDLVVASEVLEHLEYPERALEELFRVSRKYVLISVPNEPIWRISNMLRGKYITKFGNTPGHVQHWSKRSLREATTPHSGGGVRSPFPWIMALYQK